jgi:hypothetical protein
MENNELIWVGFETSFPYGVVDLRSKINIIYHCQMNTSTKLKPFKRKALVSLVTAALVALTLNTAGAQAAGNPTPTIVGTPTLGMTLTANPGAWPANTTLSYLWLSDGSPLIRYIEGEPVQFTTSTCVIPLLASGTQLQVQVTATRPGSEPVVVVSASTVPVVIGLYPGAKTPTITSSAKSPVVGTTLTANTGGWPDTDEPTRYIYKWLRDGVAINGATNPTYVLNNSDSGRKISLVVDAIGYLGEDQYLPTPKTSAAITVGGKKLESPKAVTPTITGKPYWNSTLKANPGTYPKGTTFTYVWYGDGKPLALRGEWGQPIGIHTENPLTVEESFLPKAISVQVTANIPGWAPVTAMSKTLEASSAGLVPNPPVPLIVSSTSKAWVGSTLSVNTGVWPEDSFRHQPTFTYKWFRGNTAITGATSATYKVVAADKGQTIKVTVTGVGPELNYHPYAPTPVSSKALAIPIKKP